MGFVLLLQPGQGRSEQMENVLTASLSASPSHVAQSLTQTSLGHSADGFELHGGSFFLLVFKVVNQEELIQPPSNRNTTARLVIPRSSPSCLQPGDPASCLLHAAQSPLPAESQHPRGSSDLKLNETKDGPGRHRSQETPAHEPESLSVSQRSPRGRERAPQLPCAGSLQHSPQLCCPGFHGFSVQLRENTLPVTLSGGRPRPLSSFIHTGLHRFILHSFIFSSTSFIH